MTGFPDMKALRAQIDATNASFRRRFAEIHRAFHDVVETDGSADDRAFYVEAAEAVVSHATPRPTEAQFREAGFDARAAAFPLTVDQVVMWCIRNGIRPHGIRNPALLYVPNEAMRAQAQREIDRALAEGRSP